MTPLSLSTYDLVELRAHAAHIARTVVAPRVPDLERTRRVDITLSRQIVKQGWLGATVPTRYGGMGAGHEAKTVLIEELSKVCAAMGLMLQASQLGLAMILHLGSVRQKKEWLPRIAEGTCLPTIAVTEPGSGGHVLGMTSTAERSGSEYILNGTKCFVGNSHLAGDRTVTGAHAVTARTSEGNNGVSAFIVPADSDGVSLQPQREAVGGHGFSFGEIDFRNVRVPKANRLGVEGDGKTAAYSSSILYGRPNLTAVALGIHGATVADTVAYAQKRQLYGDSIAKLGNIKHDLGEMQSQLQTAMTLAFDAVRRLDAGSECDQELINAKLVNVRMLRASIDAAMAIHGGYSLLSEYSIERYMRDARMVEAPAGTDDIQCVRMSEYAQGINQHQPWSVRFADVLRLPS